MSYTGNGNNSNSATSPAVSIGHGLSAPSMIIVKDRTSSRNWPVYHVGIGASSMCELDTTVAAQATYSWNQTAPSSSVFYVGNNGQTNNNGDNYIAYCFAPVEGYSSINSFIGNGSTDGPFVFTNMRPSWLLIKATSGSESWRLYDAERSTYNYADDYLVPSSSAAEVSSASNREIDFLSNGFKIRGNNGGLNTNGVTYIYLAFASNPFKSSRAR